MNRETGYRNALVDEYLPNARLGATARDVLDIMSARQEPGGLVRVKQEEVALRLNISQGSVSKAIGKLKDAGLLAPRSKQGQYQIHPLFAGYSSREHMLQVLADPDTVVWELTFPADDIRPSRDPRTGTGFDPDDGGGGEPAAAPEPVRHLYLAAG